MDTLATAGDDGGAEGSALGRVKRPINSFLVFSNEMRPKLHAEHRGSSNAEISKMLGSQWKSMTKEQRQEYVDTAAKIKTEFKAAHPDYVYTKAPRKVKKRKLSEQRRTEGRQVQEFLAYIPPDRTASPTSNSRPSQKFAPLSSPIFQQALPMQQRPQTGRTTDFQPSAIPLVFLRDPPTFVYDLAYRSHFAPHEYLYAAAPQPDPRVRQDFSSVL